MRGDIIRALKEQGHGAVWEHILSAKRTMWATASLILGAGRKLVHTSDGWRFSPSTGESHAGTIPMKLIPIEASVADDNEVAWRQTKETSKYRIFQREPGGEYATAMAEALSVLLRTIDTQ